jgi:exosortase C (VPDSG-CTERM-specific)
MAVESGGVGCLGFMQIPTAIPLSSLERVDLRWVRFGIYAGIWTLLFAWPLVELVRFAFGGRAALPIEISNLYTHVVLVPFISLYLGWLRWGEGGAAVASEGNPPAPWLAAGCGVVALTLLGLAWWGGAHADGWSRNDWLALTVTAWVAGLIAGACRFLGARATWGLGFAFGLLLFMAPVPSPLIQWINQASQHASADVSYWMIRMSGTPIHREGLLFHLPGITLRVAEECSGIRSSLVLLFTSWVAAAIFLRRSWKRAALILFVIPLALARNGFRILSIAWLCVHVDLGMIDSWVHRQGGPVFFVLSLIPFFLFLRWLRAGEGSVEGVNEPWAPRC